MKKLEQIMTGLIFGLVMIFSAINVAKAQPCKQYKKDCNGQSECSCNSNAECCQGKCENHECQRIWYNFPSYSKVKISRNPNGQSWLYLEFKWGKCQRSFFMNLSSKVEN